MIYSCSQQSKDDLFHYTSTVIIYPCIISIIFICYYCSSHSLKPFILLAADYLVSGVCEVLWKQSEGAWKFFYEKNAVYEYLIYMSKIEIRESYILFFYLVTFCVVYSMGVKLLKSRGRENRNERSERN
jgi:hypothetical protein